MIVFFFLYNYSHDHSGMHRVIRQGIIRARYGFTCDCLACVKNYPQVEMRDLLQIHDFIKPIEHMNLSNEYKIDEILELIPKYCQFLNENSTKFFPYNHTLNAQHLLISLLTQVYIDELPLNDKLYFQHVYPDQNQAFTTRSPFKWWKWCK